MLNPGRRTRGCTVTHFTNVRRKRLGWPQLSNTATFLHSRSPTQHLFFSQRVYRYTTSGGSIGSLHLRPRRFAGGRVEVVHLTVVSRVLRPRRRCRFRCCSLAFGRLRLRLGCVGIRPRTLLRRTRREQTTGQTTRHGPNDQSNSRHRQSDWGAGLKPRQRKSAWAIDLTRRKSVASIHNQTTRRRRHTVDTAGRTPVFALK